MKITLIGMPAAGKTTLGKIWSNQLHIPFIDLDEEITKRENKSIATLFTEEGETYFRAIEKEILDDLLILPYPLIIATGGGTPCFHNNLTHINQAGISIFLNTPLEKIIQRLSTTKTDRPLFKNLPIDEFKKKVIHLYNQRLPYYTQAAYKISQDSDKDTIRDLIKKKISF